MQEAFGLTDEETAELMQRPIDPESVPEYTPEQFNLRQKIGAKISHLAFEDLLKSNSYQAAVKYLKYPPHLFYLSKDEGQRCRRIYGVACREDETFVAHTITAMSMVNNIVIGGVPFEDLTQLPGRWPPEKEAFLRSGTVPDPGIFLDPLGFLAIPIDE